MVEKQIASRGIRDVRILEALRKVPRHHYAGENDLAAAYGDYPLPIGCEQTISQPYIVAFMTEALLLTGAEKVLEVGTGCGYQTAILAEVTDRVFTVEINERLGAGARKKLDDAGYENISFKVGDGRLGWPSEAPFDGILVTAAPAALPDGLVDQLKVGGRLIIPLGEHDQVLVRYVKTEAGFTRTDLLAVRFVPLL
jgi:protein-L-isoaspartate(D-aspartate) O-methyltransferase